MSHDKNNTRRGCEPCSVALVNDGLYLLTFGSLMMFVPEVNGLELSIIVTPNHVHHILFDEGVFYCDGKRIAIINDFSEGV